MVKRGDGHMSQFLTTKRASRTIVAVLAMTALGGCAGFLPNRGPTTDQILNVESDASIDYRVVQMDPSAVAATTEPGLVGFSGDFVSVAPQSPDLLGVGDTLEIRVWENVEDGLFGGPAPITSIIGSNGHVVVPYAGSVHASGRSPESVARTIASRLEEQTLKPQVTVNVLNRASRAVSVQGAVGTPGVIPLDRFNNRLLAVLAQAGGVRAANPAGGRDDAHGSRVMLRRGGQTTSAYLEDVYSDPANDLALRSGDVIIVESRPRYYNMFGAIRGGGRQSLDRRDISVLNALSAVGGLDDQTANPTGIFIFRKESEETIAKLTPAKGFEDVNKANAEKPNFGDGIPVVYQLALNSAEAMFVADSFHVREGDTIYVTNAPYTQFRKVLSIITPALGTVGSVNSLPGTNFGN
ncbi:MAG: polysaccharide export protein [Neomegalonema sp.]|nr:polysaccharide export protein [Neomegalonema sp.]